MKRLLPIAVFAAVLGAAVPAAAHVTVSAPGAAPGGYTTLTFKVPTESATASTNSLRVQLPTDTPIASVSVQPKPGWTIKVTRSKVTAPVQVHGQGVTEVVSEISWTASAAAQVGPDQFDTFLVSAGPLPQVEKLTFRAIQGYSDGKDVAWTEVAAPGSTAELAHPAPTLTLAAANAPANTAAPQTDDSDGSTALPTVLSVLALVLAAAALALSLRGRRAP